MRRITPSVLIIALILGVSGGWMNIAGASPQSRQEQPPQDPTLEKMQKNAEKQRNEKRQSDLKRDTDELYKLASDLKKSVDSSNEHVLSLEVLRKTEAIQKLAKSVHDKMKAEGYTSTIPQ